MRYPLLSFQDALSTVATALLERAIAAGSQFQAEASPGDVPHPKEPDRAAPHQVCRTSVSDLIILTLICRLSEVQVSLIQTDFKEPNIGNFNLENDTKPTLNILTL